MVGLQIFKSSLVACVVKRKQNLQRGAYDLTYPIPLETVLRTEEAVFYALLKAGGTLEGAGIVIAVRPAALALRLSFGSHGETLLLRLTTEG